MGLFNKTKLNKTEEELLQKMVNSRLIDDIIYTFFTADRRPEYQWIRIGERGDSGCRSITVEPDGIMIEKTGAFNENDKEHCVVIDFVQSGYSQIKAHTNNSGKTDISCSRMCFLYATALKSRLQAIMKDCEFREVTNYRNLDRLNSDSDLLFAIGALMDAGARAGFDYYVPVPSSSNLF